MSAELAAAIAAKNAIGKKEATLGEGATATGIQKLNELLDRFTDARAAFLDAAVTSRASAADYTAARAALLDRLDATIASRAAAATALSNATWTDARAAKLENLDALVSSRAAAVDYTAGRAAKLDNLDAAVSTRSSHSAADVWAAGTRTLTQTVSSHTAADVWSVGTRALTDKAGFALSAAGIDAVWDEVVDGGVLTARTAQARLDAAVSSRSSHTAADVWAVGTRALTDKAGFALSGAAIDAVWDEVVTGTTSARTAVARLDAAISSRSSHSAADVWSVGTRRLTNLDDTRAAKIDNLNATIASRSSHSAADVWNVATRTLTQTVSSHSAADVWSVATRRLTNLDDTRAAKIDNLDAAISSRLAAASYTAPDNAGISNIWDAVSGSTGAVYRNVRYISDSAWTNSESLGTKIAAMRDAISANLNATVASRSSHSAADVWSVGTRTLTQTVSSHSAADVWGVTTRRLTNLDDTRAAKIDNLDAQVSSRKPRSVATGMHDTYGVFGSFNLSTWKEVVASAAQVQLITSLGWRHGQDPAGSTTIEIAFGAAGAESVVARFGAHGQSWSMLTIPVDPPLRVPAGTRVSVRTTTTQAADAGLSINYVKE